MAKVSKAKRAAFKRYAAKTAQYMFRLRLDQDADVIARLDEVDNKTDYIRQLIRKDMSEA